MEKRFELPLADVINGAVGPFGPYCMGYLNPGASGNGYIAAMKLSVDKVKITGLDPGTEGIVSYDRCEKDDAYIGQINMGSASSFCGINGALWGYDLAQADCIGDRSLRPLFYFPEPDYPRDERLPKQKPVPVYPVGPLLDAAIRLFGRIDKEATQVDRRRFPPMPGAHVICANKAASQRGPGYIWCAIAVAIAADRHKDANLFVEDANVIPVVETVDSSGRQIVVPSREQVEMILQQSLRAVAKSVLLCGQDQNVVFDKIYLGAKFIYARTDEWGCALTCAPYVVLAQDAVVPGKPAAHIMDLTITQWEQRLGLTPLPAVQPATESGSIGVEGWENDASHGGDP